MLCDKIDKPLVVYRIVTSIITLCEISHNFDVFFPKNMIFN